jgi:hypothetical protein
MNESIIRNLKPILINDKHKIPLSDYDLLFMEYCSRMHPEEFKKLLTDIDAEFTNMKVLFLDFDGVLNSASTMKHGVHLCNKRVVMLSELCKELDLNVVISSSWRILYSLSELKEMLHRTGFGGRRRIIDVTNEHNTGHRGIEIKIWLTAHPEVTKYAIIDDDRDMLLEQQPYFVRTSWKTGLNQRACSKLRDIFTK